MADKEQAPDNKEQAKSPEALEQDRQEHQERLNKDRHENLERTAEQSHETSETLTHEALEQATSKEKDQTAQRTEKESDSKERRHDKIVPKSQRAAAYKKTMKQVQTELSPASRAFSKVIHNKVVERVSDAVGSTLARPNAILTGSVLAFVFTLIMFLVARYYGYPLSGSETIAAFALGWIVGLLIDYLRLEFTGGKS
jgi:hypothetical protein